MVPDGQVWPRFGSAVKVLQVGAACVTQGILSVCFPFWIPRSPTAGISPRLELVPLTVLDPRLKAGQTHTHRRNGPALPVFLSQCPGPCGCLELHTHFGQLSAGQTVLELQGLTFLRQSSSSQRDSDETAFKSAGSVALVLATTLSLVLPAAWEQFLGGSYSF